MDDFVIAQSKSVESKPCVRGCNSGFCGILMVDRVGSRFAPGPADESAHGNKQTPSGTRDPGPDVLCVCPWNSPGSATPSAATPSAATRSATAAGSGNASSGTPCCTITVHGDCVLHRQRYRIWHPRL